MHPFLNNLKMSEETIQQRLQRASAAWSRIFQNTKAPHTTHNPTHATQSPTAHTAKGKTSSRTQQKIPITQDSLKQNNHWGNEITEKGDNILRLYTQNVNGIKVDADGGQYKEILDIVKEVQADVFCCQEHNLDTTQFKIRDILHNATKKQFRRCKLTISSSPIKFSGHWKPGGTAILSNGQVTGRITASGHDEWGRWCYQTILGQRGRHITIVSAYQVVAQNHRVLSNMSKEVSRVVNLYNWFVFF